MLRRLALSTSRLRSLPPPRHSIHHTFPNLRTTSSMPPPPAPPPAHPDGMTRFPSALSTHGHLRGLDYLGTLSFASSGAAAAALAGMDAFGAVAIGTVTAVGGGTIRDAIILRKTPFWTCETEYLYGCILAAGGTFWMWPRGEDGQPRDYGPMQWGDALGVGAFAVIGVQNGIRAGVPPIVQLICAISTATFGGAVRDLTLRKPIRILHSHAELYASTAAAGGLAYMGTRAMGGPVWLRIWAGVGTAVAGRWASWTWGVRLPSWTGVQESDVGKVLDEKV